MVLNSKVVVFSGELEVPLPSGDGSKAKGSSSLSVVELETVDDVAFDSGTTGAGAGANAGASVVATNEGTQKEKVRYNQQAKGGFSKRNSVQWIVHTNIEGWSHRRSRRRFFAWCLLWIFALHWSRSIKRLPCEDQTRGEQTTELLLMYSKNHKRQTIERETYTTGTVLKYQRLENLVGPQCHDKYRVVERETRPTGPKDTSLDHKPRLDPQ